MHCKYSILHWRILLQVILRVDKGVPKLTKHKYYLIVTGTRYVDEFAGTTEFPFYLYRYIFDTNQGFVGRVL